MYIMCVSIRIQINDDDRLIVNARVQDSIHSTYRAAIAREVVVVGLAVISLVTVSVIFGQAAGPPISLRPGQVTHPTAPPRDIACCVYVVCVS